MADSPWAVWSMVVSEAEAVRAMVLALSIQVDTLTESGAALYVEVLDVLICVYWPGYPPKIRHT